MSASTLIRRTQSVVANAASYSLIALVRAYQLAVSPLIHLVFGPPCRFYPSCSQYFILAVRKHGPMNGSLKGVGRLCRCHPWRPGGYDPP